MNKKLIKILIIFIAAIIILLFTFIKNNNKFIDTVRYDKKNYVLLEYNRDVFTYYHNSNTYYEEDVIHPVKNNKWDIVYFNGDLFVFDKEVKKAIQYYKDDKNYEWYVVFDNEDIEIKKAISISKEEITYLYNLNECEKSKTIVFDDIGEFASILKLSKDGLVQAIITLAQVDGIWYYKTETMTDDDREYVIKITDSLNKKINNLMQK